MAGTNTEKPTSKAEKKKTAPVSNKVNTEVKAPVKTEKKTQEKTEAKKTETQKTEAKKEEKPVVKKVKKDSVKAYGRNLKSSTKVAAAICRFIRRKKVEKAIADLEDVIKMKKAVPMKGEIPHRKGSIMSGRFPQRAAQEVLIIVKNLQNNATQHEMENPVISEAVANKAMRPFAKGGRARKKRSHVVLTAIQKKVNKQTKNKK